MTASVKLEELEALAKAATPGPWSVYDRGVGYMIALDNGVGHRVLPEGFRTDLGRKEDAEFIAAADPQTVSELVAHIRWLKKELEATDRENVNLARRVEQLKGGQS
ncbi:hypothetical protein [Rhodococcus jostii]|uniref:hypothetical protein n=1 Tax=Rhodococcus jostii TaxID=132919 RepID=UPI003640C952